MKGAEVFEIMAVLILVDYVFTLTHTTSSTYS